MVPSLFSFLFSFHFFLVPEHLVFVRAFVQAHTRGEALTCAPTASVPVLREFFLRRMIDTSTHCLLPFNWFQVSNVLRIESRSFIIFFLRSWERWLLDFRSALSESNFLLSRSRCFVFPVLLLSVFLSSPRAYRGLNCRSFHPSFNLLFLYY